MFIVETPPENYTPPWSQDLLQRRQALQGNGSKIAYFYEQADCSTFRYRVYNMIQTLSALDGNLRASFFTNEDFSVIDEVLKIIDVLVVCRTRYSPSVNLMITKAKRRGIKVLFDIDDMVFDPLDAHLVANTLDLSWTEPHEIDDWFSSMGRLGATLKLCDGTITTNQFLAGKIQEFSSKPTYVIPNFMNAEQLDISSRIYKEKQERNFARNDFIHLGYFSGSPTHNRDLEILSEALAELFLKYPELKLRILGYIDLKESLKKFESQIEILPMHDFVNLQRQISLVELNLVPLQQNTFTNCKSELKFFEAAAVGTITIASPVFTYTNAIQDGKNGYLAYSYQWLEKIESIISNFDDYSKIAKSAYNSSIANYAWYNQGKLIYDTLFSDPH